MWSCYHVYGQKNVFVINKMCPFVLVLVHGQTNVPLQFWSACFQWLMDGEAASGSHMNHSHQPSKHVYIP